MLGSNKSQKLLYKRRTREVKSTNDVSPTPHENPDIPSAQTPQLIPTIATVASQSLTSVHNVISAHTHPNVGSASKPTPPVATTPTSQPRTSVHSSSPPLASTPSLGFFNGKPILLISRNGFIPSHVAESAISELIKNHYLCPWTSWKKIPPTLKHIWFQNFLLKFHIDSKDHQQALHNFEMRGAALLKVHLKKARLKGARPQWIPKDVWTRLCTYWNFDKFRKLSSIAKANRASDSDGSAASTHVGGSISMSQHRFNMEKKYGVVPSPVDVFHKTHQRGDETWANKKSEQFLDKFNEQMSKNNEDVTSSGSSTAASVLNVWCDVVGVKNGQIYGLGSKSKVLNPRPRYRGSSSRASSTNLKRELEEIRLSNNQLKDQLTNTNKKVEDLEAKYEQILKHLGATPFQMQVPPRSPFQPKRGDHDDKDDDETQPHNQPFE